MIPALFTSSSALTANEAMLSVVGNNLANSNTAGYKSQSLLFSNQFSEVLSNASQPTAAIGGKNPIQIGMGVQVSATSTNLAGGTFQSTGNPLDMAIQGDGYFVLKAGSQSVYSRAGAFALDASGNMVDPATGAKVQRVGTVGEGTATTPVFQQPGNYDINIPKGLSIPGSATQNVYFTGNLNANAVGPLKDVMTTTSALTTGGVAATLNTSLNDLDQTQMSALTPTGYQSGDIIQITGTLPDGSTVNAQYDPSGTSASDTVGALIASINQAYQSGSTTGATASLDSKGNIVLTGNSPGVSKASLFLTSSTTNGSGTTTNFSNFAETTAGKAGDKATTVIQVFDSQGTPHDVTFTFTKQSANLWNISAAIPAADGSITGFGEDNTVAGATFNMRGQLQSIIGNSVPEILTSTSPMTSGGVPADVTTTLENLDQHSPAGTPYDVNDIINITGTDYTGNAINVALPAYDPITGSPVTVGEMLTAINTAYSGGVAALDSSGNIVFTGTHTGQSVLKLSIKDDPNNVGGSTTSFSSFTETQAGTNGNNSITFSLNNLNGAKQTIVLNMNSISGNSPVSQTGAGSSISASYQDGYAQGTLESESISQDGTITGKFTNGQSMALAQVALATFTNPQGLQNYGNNYLLYTTASGLPTVIAPLTGRAGSLQSGGLEGSNVDIGTEFTNLISAQRGYEVNAKAFSAANNLMQATVDLIR